MKKINFFFALILFVITSNSQVINNKSADSISKIENEKQNKIKEKKEKQLEKARKDAEKKRKEIEKEKKEIDQAKEKVNDLKKEISKSKNKIEKEREKLAKDKRKGKLSPNEEIKQLEKIEKMDIESVELEIKLVKAQRKLDKID